MAVPQTGPGPLTAAFLIREANGMYRSREEVDVDGGETGLEPGTILGRTTATGVYARHNPAGTGGVQTVAGILWQGIPAYSGEDAYAAGDNVQRRTVVVRDAEVHKTELIYSAGADATAIAAADTALRGLGIIPRL